MEKNLPSRKPGLFGRIKQAILNISPSDEKAWNPSLWNLASAKTNSGVQITEETALTYSAVYNAITIYSGTISTLPLRLLIEKSGKKVPAVEKSAYQVMHTQWNPYMTAQIGREVMIAHTLSWGNGYAEKKYDGQGNLVELWPIAPHRVKPEFHEDKLTYVISVDGVDYRFPREKILHIPGLGYDGFVGYSVIGMARESIGLSMAMEQFGSKFFGAGTHPGVIVTHPGKLGEQASKNLSTSLINSYSGLGKSHRLLLLEEGMSLQSVGVPPEDAQFLQSRQFQIPEIARWFNLPPHKLKDLTKSSFSNIESEQISFLTESILPWVIRFETNFNSQLLSQAELKKGYYFKHVLEGLLRGDSKSRAEFYAKMWGLGAMSINEIRGKEDFDPIEGGDRYFVPMNFTPLDKIDEEPKEIPNDNQPAQPIEQDNELPSGEQKNKRSNVVPL